MTNAIKSKTSGAWTPVLLGCFLLAGFAGTAYSQVADEEQSFGELSIRGTIDEVEDGSEVFEESQTPIELNRIVTNTPVRRVQAAEPVGSDPEESEDGSRVNLPVDPVQTGTTPILEDEPFEPTGSRIGNTEVRMSLEQSIGYSSNVSQQVGGSGGAFSQTDAAIDFTSDWSRHQLRTSIAGSYRKPFDGDAIEDISVSADTELFLEMTDGWALITTASYAAQTQEFTSSTLAPGAIDTPLLQIYGGGLELQRTDRRLQVSLRGSLFYSTFEDADLGGGVTQSQADQDNVLYDVTMRLGYETTPAFTPFVEGVYGIREFDQEVDRNGNRRDSTTYELRAGVEVDLGEKVQGEWSIGYLTEQFDDPLLEDLDGFTVNGAVNWSPERDTQVSLTFGTQTISSIAADENGGLLYDAQLDYQRRVNDRTTFNAFAGIRLETNDDRNTTLEIGTGVEYWVNRFMAITGDVEYVSFSSDAVGSDFDEVTARVGVRLQR